MWLYVVIDFVFYISTGKGMLPIVDRDIYDAILIAIVAVATVVWGRLFYVE